MAQNDLSTIVQNESLLSILRASNDARNEAVSLLQLVEEQRRSVNSETPEQGNFKATSDKQRKLCAQISELRTMNRRLALDIRNAKSLTGSSRNEIDTLHLSLQNLYYEQRHLRGEISACESYPHKYTELPLIPAEEFMARFPDMQGKHEEDIMRARIQEEHRDRTELEDQRQALLKRKQELMAGNAKRKEELVNLDKDLEAFIDAAKPIQKTFEKEY